MKRYFSYIIAILFTISVLGGSCREDDLGLPGTGNNPLAGSLKVGATISQPQGTRSYFADGTTSSGPVVKGKFTIAYPYTYSWINTPEGYGKQYYFYYHYGEVNFGFAGEETTGFVNIGTATAPKELIWSPSNSSANEGIIYYPNVNTPSPMYLDNFPYLTTTDALKRDTVCSMSNFPDNPFKAGVFDAENGTNDLLWGTTKAKSGEDFIEFELYHRMTRLQITVNVDNSNISGYKTSLKNAKVWIENLLIEPKTYLRKYGELRFEERKDASSLQPEINPALYDTEFTLVEGNLESGSDNDSGQDDDTDNSTEDWNSLTWALQPDEVAYSVQTYQTKDFVFVPQTLRQGQTIRPKLVIQVPIDDVNDGVNPGYQDYIYYSGNLPYTMNLVNADGSDGGLLTLDFLKGYVINLTTKLTPGQPELLFAPVTVEPWVWKGSFKPESRQAGIFNADDFYALIKVYQENNSFWLGKYGFISAANQETGTWTFQFNTGEQKLEVDKIMDTMHPGTQKNGPNGETVTPPFTFDFRSRNQNLVMPNGQVVGLGYSGGAATTLYDIVTAQRNLGVGYLPQGQDSSPYTFQNLITAYQTNDWKLFYYGSFVYDDKDVVPGSGKWTFKIVENLTLDYNDILAQMIPDPDNFLSDFNFQIEPGVTVTVNNYPDMPDQTLEVTSTNANQLYEILSIREPGVYSAEQFSNLMDIYNSGLDLEDYQAPGDGNLVFPIWRNLTLTSQLLQGQMKELPGRPYSFNLQDNKVTLRQFDNSSYTNTTAEQLYQLVNLNQVSGIGDQEDMLAMANAYNTYTGAAAQISTYGYYCFNSPRWVFLITAPLRLYRSQIEGIIEEKEGQLPFSFNFNKNAVYILEDNDSYELLSGDDGPAKLKAILLGEQETPGDGN
ncbi:MAG: hypothetical protein J1E82_03910 [Muribaculaceae bacterium]|nr:hypothetical protein [Muribaculaceae bacterium]